LLASKYIEVLRIVHPKGEGNMADETRESSASEMASKGGTARAKSLSPERRREIARNAVETRWMRAEQIDGEVSAPHNGTIRIGELEIPCGVLEDGVRVLSERGVMKALGVHRGGSAHKRAKQEAEKGGGFMPLFLAQINLKPFIDLELAEVVQNPIWYRPTTGPNTGILHKGVRADLLPKICNVWLKARDAGVIRGVRQIVVVANADIINRGLAEVGITALVDEATGFQDVRARDALAKILERFVAKEIQPYLSAFPLDFFRELCRLKNVAFREDMRLPPYFGRLVNSLVYCRLAPGVLAELQRVNPVTESGRRKTKNYKLLTPTVGHPKLLQLLGSEVTLMRMSATWDEFKELVDKYHEIYKPLPLLEWAERQAD
jgi:hypothetical protein